MVERKLQFTGGSSFIVSLPKAWVSKHGLKTGNVVHIAVENDGSLRLSPKHIEAGPKESTISKSTTESTLMKIIAAYVAGADKIIVKGSDTAEVCEEARLVLSGLEIVEEHKDKTVMQVFANEEVLNFGVLLRRLYLVSDVMCNLAIRSIANNEDLRLEAQRRDNDADRLYLLIMRCLYNTSGSHSPMKAIAARTIERVADHAEKICLSSAHVAPNSAFASLLKDTVQLYEDSFKSFMESRFEETIFERQRQLLDRQTAKLAELVDKEHNKDKALALRSLAEDNFRILNYSLNLSEIAANMVYVGEKATGS